MEEETAKVLILVRVLQTNRNVCRQKLHVHMCIYVCKYIYRWNWLMGSQRLRSATVCYLQAGDSGQ
jgi:hypothetical protein